MGPTRLTGSPQHSAFVQYLKDQLTNILHPDDGSVFKKPSQIIHAGQPNPGRSLRVRGRFRSPPTFPTAQEASPGHDHRWSRLPRSPRPAPAAIILWLTASTLSSFRQSRLRPEASCTWAVSPDPATTTG